MAAAATATSSENGLTTVEVRTNKLTMQWQ